MISPAAITPVMQASVRPETTDAVHSVRSVLPGARLVLSTFPHNGVDEWLPLVFDDVESAYRFYEGQA